MDSLQCVDYNEYTAIIRNQQVIKIFQKRHQPFPTETNIFSTNLDHQSHLIVITRKMFQIFIRVTLNWKAQFYSL